MTIRLLSDETPDLLEGTDTLPQEFDYRQYDFPQSAVDEIVAAAEHAEPEIATTILTEAIGQLRDAIESL